MQAAAQTSPFCISALMIAKAAPTMQNGGSARGYSAGVASLAAR